MIYLDTHAVVWLYAGETSRFTPEGRDLMERNDLLVSPMVELELQFLKEIGRLEAFSSQILESLRATTGLTICPLPFSRVIVEAAALDWTRDPFDRIIAGQSRAGQAPLLTKDQLLHKHFELARW